MLAFDQMEHRLCDSPTVCHCCAKFRTFADKTCIALVEVGDEPDAEWYNEEEQSGEADDNDV